MRLPLAIGATVFFPVGVLVCAGQPGPDQAWKWVSAHSAELIEAVLPKESVQSTTPDFEILWRITVRTSQPGSSRPETLVSATRTMDGSIEGFLSQPSKSVFRVAEEIIREDPTLRVEDVASRIRVKRIQATDDTCTGLSRMAERYEQLSLSPLLSDALYVDGKTYKAWLQSRYGQSTMVLTLRGPTDSTGLEDHPLRDLLSWIAELVDALEQCEQS